MATELLNGRAVKMSGGRYAFQTTMSSGAVTLQMKIDRESTFQDMTSGSFTADADKEISLPVSCEILANITGDGVAYIEKIGRN